MPHPRARLAVVAACAVAAVAHQATHWHWFIEDAAISFAYARNLIDGFGLVPFPGGERVEAVSNPTWVALLALFQAVGLDGFTIAKPLAAGLTAWTVYAVWRIASLALPDHRGPGALVACVALAASAQHAIWSASGLENALFAALLAGMVWRIALEARDGGAPWSALIALLLAWTRPEGLAYAATAGAWYAAATWRSRGWRPAAVWAAAVLLPSLVLEGLRLAYFAWPLPNTVYAKVGSHGIVLLDWDARGWGQLREWAGRLWTGWWAPVVAIAVVGRRHTWWVLAAVGGLAAWLWWPSPPESIVLLRLLAVLGLGMAAPLFALQHDDPSAGVARGLSGHLLVAGLGYAIAVDGDWMGAYRWMSLVAVPLAVLIAVGLTLLADRLAERTDGAHWGPVTWTTLSIATGLLLPPNLSQTRDHLYYNTDVTPHEVRRRLDYLREIVQRTHHLGEVVNFDIDMGAFLWWAPDFRVLDMGGLVDVPMAHHWYQQRAFITEYLRDERPPTFANVGNGNWWTRHTGMRQYDWFVDDYFVLPGYETGRGAIFPGIHARRDLITADPAAVVGPRRVTFEQGLSLADLRLPAPWVAGQPSYVETPLVTDRVRAQASGIVLKAFLAGQGRLHTWVVPLDHGLLDLDGWGPAEALRGRHTTRLPQDWPDGRYTLGLVVTGPGGRVWRATEAPAGAELDGPPLVAAGEVRFPDAVEVVSSDVLAERVTALRTRVRQVADAGDCGDSERLWEQLARHRATRPRWVRRERGEVAPAIGACWARATDGRPDAEAARLLERSHRWSPYGATLRERGAPVAARLLDSAAEAWSRDDWDAAYADYSLVLRFQPTRAWVRRWAEEARDERLGLRDDVRIGRGGEDDLRRTEASAEP